MYIWDLFSFITFCNDLLVGWITWFPFIGKIQTSYRREQAKRCISDKRCRVLCAMAIKNLMFSTVLLSSDRKLSMDGLKMSVIVLPDPVLWFGTSQVVCLFLLTESQWKVTSFAPDKVWSSEKNLSCQRKSSESLGSAGQCASFNANAFLAVCFWAFTSASVLVAHSQHFIQTLSNK